jgi:hypothetical protein
VRPTVVTLLGIALFLFIPLVLYLFVVHPEPIAGSLVAGVALMVGHRFLAAPYADATRSTTCIWCNRVLDGEETRTSVEVGTPGGSRRFVACTGHAEPAGRFFAWLDRCRLPLRLGIGVPLMTLLASLAGTTLGWHPPLAAVTDLFRLIVGLTVQVAALGPLLGTVTPTSRAAFPLHNFSLLGQRNLLWILRLVGLWWVIDAGRSLLVG